MTVEVKFLNGMAPRFLLSKHQRQKVSNEIYSLAFNGTAIQTQIQKQLRKKEEKWDKMYILYLALKFKFIFPYTGAKTNLWIYEKRALKMWILTNLRFFKTVNLWRMRLWNCEFCQKWDFEIVNFIKKWDYENENFVKNEQFWKREFWDKLRIFTLMWISRPCVVILYFRLVCVITPCYTRIFMKSENWRPRICLEVNFVTSKTRQVVPIPQPTDNGDIRKTAKK